MNQIVPSIAARRDETSQAASRPFEPLADLVDRIEQFLLAQVGRLQSCLREGEEAANQRDQLAAIMTEFQQERENWELRRQQELLRLNQEGAALAEAWQQLEDEQRRLFAERERLRARVATGTPPAQPDSRGELAAAGCASAQTTRGREMADRAEEAVAAGMTWLQLQQLQLEIQKHARRKA